MQPSLCNKSLGMDKKTLWRSGSLVMACAEIPCHAAIPNHGSRHLSAGGIGTPLTLVKMETRHMHSLLTPLRLLLAVLVCIFPPRGRHFDGDRYILHAWVIMPNHVHLLVSMAAGIRLEKVIASWKRFSANQIQQRRGTIGGIWQKDYFDRLIRNEGHFRNVVRYIRNNPVKGNLPVGEYQLYAAPWA